MYTCYIQDGKLVSVTYGHMFGRNECIYLHNCRVHLINVDIHVLHSVAPGVVNDVGELSTYK
jgi:hypothetical protein